LGTELTQQVLDDYERAPIRDQLRATLAFLKKLTLTPDQVTADDARQVLALGVSKAALADAIYVASTFNVFDRLADTMGWHVPPVKAFEVGAKRLIARGYL
jgi:alkylhydroperoxidase family enzyme